MQKLFESKGFDVDTAASVRAAEALLDAGGYAVVITDYALPDGNLDDLVDHAEIDPARTIVVSGTPRVADFAERFRVLPKPVDVARLLSWVDEIVSS